METLDVFFERESNQKRENCFDRVRDRRDTESMKWSFQEDRDILPLTVSDMDFVVAEPIRMALLHRLDHEIFGYSKPSEFYYNALISWFDRRHHWNIKKEWVVFTNGCAAAVYIAIQCFSVPGDKILVQTPVYFPFVHLDIFGRTVVYNPLKFDEEKSYYTMDFEDLSHKLKEVKIAIFCNPHNPVGRVWDREDMEHFGRLCMENNVLVIADEIHSDLIISDKEFIPFASLNEEFLNNSITTTSTSKTFNISGMTLSNIIIPNEKLRNSYNSGIYRTGFMAPSCMSIVSTETAFTECDLWLDNLLDYLRDNFCFLKNELESKLKGVKVCTAEGTSLAWVDFRCFNISHCEMKTLMLQKGKVRMEDGSIFGKEGDGFFRLNFGCPRALLQLAIERIVYSLKSLINC